MVMAMAAAAPQLLSLNGPASSVPSCSTSSVPSSSHRTCNCSSSVLVPSLRLPVARRDARAGLIRVSAVATEDAIEEDGFEGAGSLENLGISPKEVRQYPQGLQKYETMAVLRPDISEDQRLALTQRYEEAIIAGGGLDVEMFNRGMQPLAYNIKVKNMGGVASRYLDGIYLLFTYVTAPKAQLALQQRMNADDDVIRHSTFRLKA